MTLACAHSLCNAQRMTNATRDLISSAVTADKLGIDRATLTRWRKAGKITAAYVTPAVVLFDPAEVDRVKAELDAAAEGVGAMTTGVRTVRNPDRTMRCASCRAQADVLVLTPAGDIWSSACRRHTALHVRRAVAAPDTH